MPDPNSDARFEDGADAPLHLMAQDAEDLGIIAALVQDAVFPITDMAFDPKRRRFALLINRFRWEDAPAAEVAGRSFERVRSLLVIEDVARVRTNGIDRAERDVVLSVLTMSFAPGPDGMGTLTLTLAGDGAVALDVEALGVQLDDVTRPHKAAARAAPRHDD
jgi:Protein of unknown function (DUF2948)